MRWVLVRLPPYIKAKISAAATIAAGGKKTQRCRMAAPVRKSIVADYRVRAGILPGGLSRDISSKAFASFVALSKAAQVKPRPGQFLAFAAAFTRYAR
jgi:hypothetical protein